MARKSRSRQYDLFLQEGGNLLLINTVAAAHKSGVFILEKYPLGESWPYKWIFIYILCLINIHISFPNQAIEILLLNAHWKTITIPVIPENLSSIYQFFLEKFSSKNSKVYKDYMISLAFFPPSNFTVFDCCYFLCYWLQRAENCSNLSK